MKLHEWNSEKNDWLKSNCHISFEEVMNQIQSNNIIAQIDHYNQKKYPNQRIYILKINSYVYMVPFVEDEHKIFLKTIIPNRKATKKYL